MMSNFYNIENFRATLGDNLRLHSSTTRITSTTRISSSIERMLSSDLIENETSFWIDMPSVEAIDYIFVLGVTFIMSFCVGLTGIGNLVIMPVAIALFIDLNPATVFATALFSFIPMSLTGLYRLKSYYSPLIKDWIIPPCIASFSAACCMQFIFSILPDQSVITVFISFLCLIGGTIALREGYLQKIKEQKVKERKLKNVSPNSNQNVGSQVLQYVNPSSNTKATKGIGSSTTATEQPSDLEQVEIVVEKDKKDNSQDRLNPNNSEDRFNPNSTDEGPPPFPPPGKLERYVLIGEGIALGVCGGPVIVIPTLIFFLPRLTARRCRKLKESIAANSSPPHSPLEGETPSAVMNPESTVPTTLSGEDSSSYRDQAFLKFYMYHRQEHERKTGESLDNLDFGIEIMWHPLRIIGITHCIATCNLVGGVAGALIFNSISLGLALLMSVFTVSGIFCGIILAKKLKADLLKILVGVVLGSVGLGMLINKVIQL